MIYSCSVLQIEVEIFERLSNLPKVTYTWENRVQAKVHLT